MLTRKQLKRIGVDILGYFLIIAAGLTGWLPGPGGLPLLILGLSLLATNHQWADRLLKSVQKQGVEISQKLFSDKPVMRWGIDIASIALIAIAVMILRVATHSLTKTTAIALIISASFLLLGNRERLNTLRKNIFRHKDQ
jgi:hypothetical protein